MARRHAYDGDFGCIALALRGPEEEGEYEYTSDHSSAENGETEEAHVEPALLIQPLGKQSGPSEESAGAGGTMVPIKGGAECFSRAGCGRKDRILSRPPEHNSFTEWVNGACALYGYAVAPEVCGGVAIFELAHH
jgi:hypothetical protein